MISEVPHLSQEFCEWWGRQHHFVSIISFLPGWTPTGSGAQLRRMWGAISNEVGRSKTERPMDEQIRAFPAAMVRRQWRQRPAGH